METNSISANDLFQRSIPPSTRELLVRLERDLALDPALNYHSPYSQEAYLKMEALLKRTLFLGGKRFRPQLLFLMGDLFQIQDQELLPYARAAELVHIASLCHDDVIDQANLRRGVPSINVASSNKHAILSGDYLLAQVILEIAQKGNHDILKELTSVIKHLTLGEWMQLERENLAKVEHSPLPLPLPPWEWLEEVITNKTASLIAWCCQVPSILANHSTKDTRDHAKAFGLHLGMAFQFSDDLLDQQNALLTGKDQNQDIKNRVINSMIWHLMQQNPLLWEQWQSSGPDQDPLRFKDLWISEVGISNARLKLVSRIEQSIDQARFHLEHIHSSLYPNPTEQNTRSNISYQFLNFILDYIPKRKK